jgi:hypothetical protein
MGEPITPTKNTSPLMFDVKPEDFGKMNLAGVGEDEKITGAYQEALNARKDLANQLEQRYAQPNWFKVAAGFLKPQLGGFAASLGSASEALGENIENQRAISPTVAQMRARIAAQEVPMSQQFSQQEGYKKYRENYAKTGKHDINELGRLINLQPESSVGKTLKDVIASESTIAGTQGKQLGTSLEAQEALAKYPYVDVGKFLEESQKGNIDKQKNDLIKSISSKGYYDPQDLKLKGLSELANISSAQQNQFVEKSLENSKTAGDLIDNATVQLQNLSTVRHLASSPKLEKLLGIESGANATSALFNWISSNADGDLSRLNIAARQLAEKDPSAFADFQILRKSLATNLATAREGIQNPSVASQNLLAQTNPDPRMAREAIIKLTDLQANDVNQTLGRARVMSSTRGPNGEMLDPNNLRQSAPYQSITRSADDRKKEILSGSFMDKRMPDFYSPYYEPPADQKTIVPGQKPMTTPRTNSANIPNQSRITSRDAVRAKLIERGIDPDKP